MAIAATISYFGQFPTTIILRSSTDFDGTTAQSSDPVITPGLYTFPVQAGGGVYNFHTEGIEVQNITYAGGGTLSIYKVMAGISALIKTITAQGESFDNTVLNAGESLKFVSSGATNPIVAITANASQWNHVV